MSYSTLRDHQSSEAMQIRLFPYSATAALWKKCLRLKQPIAWTLAAALVVLVGVAGISIATGRPMSYLTIDPADIGLPAYLGMLSNLGIMIWGMAAGACLLARMVLSTIPQAGEERRFFLLSALASGYLMLDDGYLLHDRVFPDVAGIPELIVFLVYGVSFLIYIYKERRIIGDSEYPLLILAAGCVGLSGGIDSALPFSDTVTAVEDSVKFVGILFWFVYFLRTAYKRIPQRMPA